MKYLLMFYLIKLYEFFFFLCSNMKNLTKIRFYKYFQKKTFFYDEFNKLKYFSKLEFLAFSQTVY